MSSAEIPQFHQVIDSQTDRMRELIIDLLDVAHLLRRVWGSDGDGDVRPMRTAISSIRRKLGDNADNPAYIFTELRVGYSMPKPDTL